MIVRFSALACAVYGASACGGTRSVEVSPAPDAPETAASATHNWVQAHPLAAGNTPFEATGQLLAPAQARASVALPLTASVIELRSDKGQHVAQGDVLAVVIIPEAARAAAQVEGERLRQDGYRERIQHLERLRAEGLARVGDISELKARLRESEATTLEARALLETIEAAGLRKRGRTYEVVAPITGVVLELRAARGDVYGPSDGALISLAGGAATRVEARFAFAPPRDVSYRLLAPDGRTVGLRYGASAPQLSTADATLTCWFDLQEPIDLAPGTMVRVQIVPAPDLWVVPRSAIGPTLQPVQGPGVAARVYATLADQALVRAQLPADGRLVVAERAAP